MTIPLPPDGDTSWGDQMRATITRVNALTDPATGRVPASQLVVAVNPQSGTAYTLVLADAGRVVEMGSASANTLTIPPNSSVAFPVGSIVEVYQALAGQTTIAAGAGVTLRAPDGARVARQYGSVSLRKRATDEWVVAGNTAV